jgi:alpha-galactosidase
MRAFKKVLAAFVVTGAVTAGFAANPASAGNPPPGSVSTAEVTGRPAMGYNTWYQYRTAANEADVLAQGQELVSSGLAAAGYSTVNLDDGWMTAKRDASGNLVADPVKFPHGMLYLAQQLHAMGLKLGIYEAIGTRTCQNFPGSYGHYKQDAALFASWQVDYVKIDACGGLPAGTTESAMASLSAQFGGDLRADSPAVLYSQELPVPWIGKPQFLPAVASSARWANSWRIAPDEYGAAPAVIGRNLNADIHLHGYAHSGHWNDLDMVLPPSIMPAPSSPSYLTDEQTQLSAWAMEASPVLVSTNLSLLSAPELADLKNPDMIAVDQSGAQSAREVTHGHVEAFTKPAEGGTALLLVNTGTGTASAVYTAAQLGLPGTMSYRNVWTGRAGSTNGARISLVPGGSALLVLQLEA